MQNLLIKENLLEQLPFWKDLTPAEQAMVSDRHYRVQYSPGQVVCGGNADCLGLILVVKGVLRTYLLSPDGKESTLYRIRDLEACVMAASCVLHSISFETHVEAETQCEALIIPIDVFSNLMNNNIYVKAVSYEMAAERFSNVVEVMERLVFLNLEQRLISFLLQESSQMDTDSIHMTHEQMAVSIGSAREAVSRTLKSIASRGWIELYRGGVHLKNKPALYQQIG